MLLSGYFCPACGSAWGCGGRTADAAGHLVTDANRNGRSRLAPATVNGRTYPHPWPTNGYTAAHTAAIPNQHSVACGYRYRHRYCHGHANGNGDRYHYGDGYRHDNRYGHTDQHTQPDANGYGNGRFYTYPVSHLDPSPTAARHRDTHAGTGYAYTHAGANPTITYTDRYAGGRGRLKQPLPMNGVLWKLFVC